MSVESKLVPILREGVDVIKMIFFMELKQHLRQQYPDEPAGYINRLTGAVLNELFGTPNLQAPFAAFVKENETLIETELCAAAENFADLRIALTDALRVQFLCDSQEGIDSEPMLVRARNIGLLIPEREVPLPKTFLALVRKLGVAYRILDPAHLADDEPDA